MPDLPGTVLIKLFSDSCGVSMANTHILGNGPYSLPSLATTPDYLILEAFQDIDGNGVKAIEEPAVFHVIPGLDSDFVQDLDLAFYKFVLLRIRNGSTGNCSPGRGGALA